MKYNPTNENIMLKGNQKFILKIYVCVGVSILVFYQVVAQTR